METAASSVNSSVHGCENGAAAVAGGSGSGAGGPCQALKQWLDAGLPEQHQGCLLVSQAYVVCWSASK